MSDLPIFRFYPGFYEDGLTERPDSSCPLCGSGLALRYRGNVRGRQKIAKPCVSCIADGRAAAAASVSKDFPEFDPEAELYCRYGAFNSIVSREPIPVSDNIDEVLNRTPAPNKWQQVDWPLHSGEPMILEGFVDYSSVASDPARLDAFKSACPRGDLEWGKKAITKGGDAGIIMFRSLAGDCYLGVLDFS